MDDRFLHEYRRDPDRGFGSDLRARLQAQPAAVAVAPRAWRPLAVAAAFAVAAGTFAFPSVRASAQSFLDLFRVRTFTPVAVDPERLRVLESESLDLAGLMSRNVELIREPGPPREVASAAEAAQVAGYGVRVPSVLPAGIEPGVIRVTEESVTRLTADSGALREVLRLLDLQDVRVPPALDGARVEVRMPAAVHMRFASDSREVHFTQSPSPDVRMPPAMDLEDIGEIALRIAGVPAGEARRMAATIDWHTTLLVPVPTMARSFRTVTIGSERGLLIEARRGTAGIPGGRRNANALLWADGERIYALAGSLHEAELLEMARSVR